jgi:signal peptidase II
MLSKYMRFAAISGLVILLDQISKALVLQNMPLHDAIEVIPGFFNLSHVRNPGGAFGFMAQHGSMVRHAVFLGAAFFALGMILYFYHQTPPDRRWFGAALAMIFGGAIGNLIDRLRFGEVVDFLDVYLGFTNLPHWPTFNIADSGVTVGVMIFLLHILFKKVPL